MDLMEQFAERRREMAERIDQFIEEWNPGPLLCREFPPDAVEVE